ncbi:MAG: phosphohydrolase, partial [Deltaproteobacteria bacterium]|nr:phosphohydrolase [Deltaproteobacteria bacterium]
MRGIRKSLLQLVFSGAYMLRWNDKLRPFPLWELDKQGHKMILAWLL